ncbi:MAG: hypothetical protein SGILL_004359 [Bacillariaceae sp.]
MNDFVADFLEKNAEEQASQLQANDDTLDSDTMMDETRIKEAQMENIMDATHLIAIPMEQAHELLLELESVQRAILHHCPILLDACIPHASTRLPLLYIQAAGQNAERVTSKLAKLVEMLVKRHIFRTAESDDPGEKDRLNAEGYRPVTMSFQSLEVEGDNNSILSTVGVLENDAENDECIPKEVTSANRFDNFMRDLQSAVASQGWKMAFPPDPNSGDDDANESFRPRVSFMELPAKFDENISYFKSEDTELTEEDMKFLTSEEGGNGISPIFWCQWWDDVFARNVRLREIGIYPRSPMLATEVKGLTRSSQFYLPYETIPLPDGSPTMLKSEKKFQDYQDKRLEEEQEKVNKAREGAEPAENETRDTASFSSASSSGSTDPDIIMTKTRKRLERIYLESNGNLEDLLEGDNALDPSSTDLIDMIKDHGEDDNDQEEIDLKTPNHPIQPQDDDYMEAWMKERIRTAVESLESEKVRKEVKKDVPPVEDNPIFKAYREGTLVPKDETPKKKPKVLGPYPGSDHFVGIWKIVDSPTGFEVDGTSENTSENLILRVDGTTAGGPTLDLENKHKAAGGTWKFSPQENGDVLLRIRLVIPPEKQRILVMEGRVQRIGSEAGMRPASRTFGIPEVEERAKVSTEEEMNLMTCSGKVHIEDAITKKNKETIGDFSLMKLHGPKDRSEYTITIPRPVQSSD